MAWNIVALRDALLTRLSAQNIEEIVFIYGSDKLREAAFALAPAAGGAPPAVLPPRDQLRRLVLELAGQNRIGDLVEWLRVNEPGLDTGQFQDQGGGALTPPAVQPVAPAVAPLSVMAPVAGLEYDDFDMAVEADPQGGYKLQVLVSSQGQVEGRTPITLQDADLVAGLTALDQGTFDPGVIRRMGVRLHALLMGDTVGNVYYAAYSIAQSRQRGLRLRLRLRAPELRRLPWEYMYDSQHSKFLAFDRVIVSRYLEGGGLVPAVPPAKPLRVLLILSNPPGSRPLDLAGERKLIEDALGPLKTAQRVTLDVLENPTNQQILHQLAADYHVIHYSGHAIFADQVARVRGEATGNGLRFVEVADNGGAAPANGGGADRGFIRPKTLVQDTGYVVLNDAAGRMQLVDEDTFADLFAEAVSLRLVILNACEGAQGTPTRRLSGLGEKLAGLAKIPAVVAMQFPIADDAAKVFAGALYDALVAGMPADRAVGQARLLLRTERDINDRAWGTPVLFMRTEDGRLFV